MAASHPAVGPFVLVFNCGSSSIKFGLFESRPDQPMARQPAWNGKVQGIGGERADFGAAGVAVEPVTLSADHPYRDALQIIRERAFAWLDGRSLLAVAHRVVHGGSRYFVPVRIDRQVLDDLRTYVPLAPLHQPFALEAMDIFLAERPQLPQIACFDTAFHHTLEPIEQMLPLPYSAWQRGLRRYGFHGLSYQYIAVALAERHGRQQAEQALTIVAHLGSGASLCAMRGLRSVATTMGFSALDGLMMGTRTGSIDPGAVLYLMEIEKLSLQQVGRTLYHESGLLGVSGSSSDPRELLALEARDDDAGERARLALQLYVRRIVREIGALVAVLGGLDRLVFTAGIGEHNATIRDRICTALAWIGVRIDATANRADAAVISTPASRVDVGVEPTNEEWVVAISAAALIAG